MTDRIHCMTCGESWQEGTPRRCKCGVSYDIVQHIADKSVEYQREIMDLRAELSRAKSALAEAVDHLFYIKCTYEKKPSHTWARWLED